MSRAKLVDYYLEKSQEPGFQIDQIRKELESNNVPDEEIKVIVRLVDNAIQNQALTKTSKSLSNELMVAGGVLTLIGAGITIGTFTGLIDMGNSFLIVYGPFIGGVSLLGGGYAQREGEHWGSCIPILPDSILFKVHQKKIHPYLQHFPYPGCLPFNNCFTIR